MFLKITKNFKIIRASDNSYRDKIINTYNCISLSNFENDYVVINNDALEDIIFFQLIPIGNKQYLIENLYSFNTIMSRIIFEGFNYVVYYLDYLHRNHFHSYLIYTQSKFFLRKLLELGYNDIKPLYRIMI